MRSEQDAGPARRRRVGEAGEREAPGEGDGGLGVAGRGEREPVRLGLVAARDRALDGQGGEEAQVREQQGERHERRVAQAAVTLGDEGDRGERGDRQQREPGDGLPDVGAGDVGQLVSGHRQDLVALEAPVEQRVMEDDRPRRPDPDHPRVPCRRAAACVGDLDLPHLHPEPAAELLHLARQRAIGQRAEPVEERLDHHRLGQGDAEPEHRGRNGPGDPPAPPEPASEPDAPAGEEGHSDREESKRDRLVSEPAGNRLLGEAVAAPPPERGAGGRERHEPHARGDPGPEQRARPRGAASDPGRAAGERAGPPREQRERGELEHRRREPEPARDAAVRLDPLERGRRQQGGRIDRGRLEVGNARPQEQPGRRRPGRPEQAESS